MTCSCCWTTTPCPAVTTGRSVFPAFPEYVIDCYRRYASFPFRTNESHGSLPGEAATLAGVCLGMLDPDSAALHEEIGDLLAPVMAQVENLPGVRPSLAGGRAGPRPGGSGCARRATTRATGTFPSGPPLHQVTAAGTDISATANHVGINRPFAARDKTVGE